MSIGDFVRLVIDTIDKGDLTEAKRMLRNWMVQESQDHSHPITVNNSQRQTNLMLVGAIGGWVFAMLFLAILVAFAASNYLGPEWSSDAVRKNQKTDKVSVEPIRPRRPERVD